ncbi:MAG: TetR family transcriptional regulator [Microbacteriaceae bacterium]|nr:TetR family transcriptional regulator [Microbacteriaceae bacterium]
MSVERIVDAAVAIADEGGLSAVSMSSVASSLGFTPMSLYRYVTAKDDLVLLMQEQAIGVPPESALEAEDWRSGIEQWAAGLSDVFERHPWVLDIPIDGTPTTPNNLAWLDAALTVLATTGLSADDRISIALAVEAQARWRGVVVRTAGGDDSALTDVAILREFVTAEEFPQIAAALAEGAFDPQEGGDPFAFGLERVLDGVDHFLAGKSAPTPDLVPQDLALRDPKVKEATKARREVEKQLREARKRERETLKNARERLAR